ncbi:hypothetical protein BH20ACI2_BH20ACI2_26840 [soil metagenome]
MEHIEVPHEPEMHRRQIELPDGRYLLFYTFETADAENEYESVNEGENAADT